MALLITTKKFKKNTDRETNDNLIKICMLKTDERPHAGGDAVVDSQLETVCGDLE
jgi:hypothetical protein